MRRPAILTMRSFAFAGALWYSVIKEINQDKHVTVVMVSHDVSAAAAYASHILHIGGDKMLFFGSKDIYTKSDVGRQFLLSKGGVQ